MSGCFNSRGRNATVRERVAERQLGFLFQLRQSSNLNALRLSSFEIANQKNIARLRAARKC